MFSGGQRHCEGLRFCFNTTPEISTAILGNMSTPISKSYQNNPYSSLTSIIRGKSQEDEDGRDLIHYVLLPAVTNNRVIRSFP